MEAHDWSKERQVGWVGGVGRTGGRWGMQRLLFCELEQRDKVGCGHQGKSNLGIMD